MAAQLTSEQRAALEIIVDIALSTINHSDYGDETTEALERRAVATVLAMIAPEAVPA
jgi:hypothetical protein